MAGLREPSDSRAGRRTRSSGRFEGDSSITTVSRGARSAIAAKTCPARSGSPAAGGDGGAGRSNGPGGVPSRTGTIRASSAQTDPGSASTASSAALRCTSAASWLTIATRVPASTNGPGWYGYCRNTGAPTASTKSWRASVSRSRIRSAGRWPAKKGWSCGKPARELKDSCQTGHPSRSARVTSAFQVSGSSAPAPTTIAGLLAFARSSASSATALGSAVRARTTRRAAARGSAGLASSAQSSMGTITRAGPLAVAASW